MRLVCLVHETITQCNTRNGISMPYRLEIAVLCSPMLAMTKAGTPSDSDRYYV
jgi:hypothetical protein